jgi:hypothetical protein
MGAETPNQVATAAQAVFLSYASQDADAARGICDALRAEGIEVWFDQSELRGGDVWDQKIRREIRDCALFIPIISANTASRHEGYFRLEWDLADQRSHMMARSRVFVVPVCLDATTEAAADVPESFRRVQWTRLPGGRTPPAFVERIKRLLSPEPSTTSRPATGAASSGPSIRMEARHISWRLKSASVAVVAVIAAAVALLFADKFWWSKRAVSSTVSTGSQLPAVSEKSVAVLPLADNLEGRDRQL